MHRRRWLPPRRARLCLALVLLSSAIPLDAQEPTSANADRDGGLTVSEMQALRRARNQPTPGEKAALVPTEADVAYGHHPRHVLDFFQATSNTPTPVMIFFHGGGFVGGDKAKGAEHFLTSQCLEAGISVVSANYRYVLTGRDGAPSKPFPGPMEDGVRVVQFVRSKASDWNIDPTRLALSGGSAGAVIAMWVGLNEEKAVPDSPDPVARFSSRVSAVISFSGPTSLDPKVILEHVGGNPQIHPTFPPSYGITNIEEIEKPEKRALAELVSPINHVSADDPPLYLKHGGTVAGTPLPPDTPFNKSIHHARFGQMLKDACDKVGVCCILSCQDVRTDTTEIDFLKEVFGLEN